MFAASLSAANSGAKFQPSLVFIAGPMQVSLGSKEPGLIPWAGSTESWICWRYPWPRPVLQLLVEGGASMLAGAKPELSFFHPHAEQFVRVAIRQEVQGGSSPGDLLYFVEVRTACLYPAQGVAVNAGHACHCSAQSLMSNTGRCSRCERHGCLPLVTLRDCCVCCLGASETEGSSM